MLTLEYEYKVNVMRINMCEVIYQRKINAYCIDAISNKTVTSDTCIFLEVSLFIEGIRVL